MDERKFSRFRSLRAGVVPKFDILRCLKEEDSYGVPLVLRDGFGGFLG
jgi:hypothetical protein